MTARATGGRTLLRATLTAAAMFTAALKSTAKRQYKQTVDAYKAEHGTI
jgi:hypothetical protein